jgi:hypothetical protein
MKVNVLDGLAAIVAGIYNYAKTVLIHAGLPSDLDACREAPSHKPTIIHVDNGWVVRLGDDEDVDRGMGLDISKSQQLIILVDYLRGYRFRRDLTEDAIVRHWEHSLRARCPLSAGNGEPLLATIPEMTT